MLGVPLAKQRTEATCGAAALLSVLRYWLGPKAPRDERALYGLTRLDPKIGIEPGGLARAARAYGLRAFVWRGLLLEYLIRLAEKRGEPSILLIQAYREPRSRDYAQEWDWGHYVVLAGRRLARPVVMDPALGKLVTLTASELIARWHGWDTGEKRYATAILIRGNDSRGATDDLPPDVTTTIA